MYSLSWKQYRALERDVTGVGVERMADGYASLSRLMQHVVQDRFEVLNLHIPHLTVQTSPHTCRVLKNLLLTSWFPVPQHLQGSAKG